MDTNTLVDIWSWFTNFPVGLATGAGAWVIGINGAIAIMVVFWRRSGLAMSKPMLCVPWMLYFFAGFASWLGGIFSGDASAASGAWTKCSGVWAMAGQPDGARALG